MTFKGKVVAITGAAGGIGQSLCRRFAAEGAAIAALDKSESLKAFMAEDWAKGVKTAHAVVDVGDREAVAEAFTALTKALGPVSRARQQCWLLISPHLRAYQSGQLAA